MSEAELTELAQQTKLETNGKVEIVGKWIWVRFGSIPSKEVRDWLKAHKFGWNAKRQVWQFAGTPATQSPLASAWLKMKYGVIEVEDN